SDRLQDPLTRKFGMGEVDFVGLLILHDGGDVVAAKFFLDLGQTIPAAKGAKTFFGELLGKQMGGAGTHEGLWGLQLGDKGVRGDGGLHAAVEKKSGSIGVELETLLRNADDGVGIAQETSGERADVHALLSQSHAERKIVGGIGFLEIGLRDGIAYEKQGFRRVVRLIEK